MRVRQYSISSSPLYNAQHATLTISVVNAPALADSEQAFLGVGSSYLAGLRAGDRVAISVRPSNALFHLPANLDVPVVMFAAGSGLAPMRGFIQERVEQRKTGRQTGRMVLYYGCRSPEDDYLYSDSDLKEWEALGVVQIRPAFSMKTEVQVCARVSARPRICELNLSLTMLQSGARRPSSHDRAVQGRRQGRSPSLSETYPRG
jgi:cytochrome P450/NADPH-cytochrome P450 reductase